MIRIGLLLSSPSPHQVELLNSIARREDVDAFAGYVQSHNPSRHWGSPTPDLPWELLPTSWLQLCKGDLREWIANHSADIWLLSSVYTSLATQLLARILKSQGESFAFLGEPPQPRSGLRAFVRHRLMMSILSKADAVIGTGVEAARRYRELTRPDQAVESVPYYVDVSAQLQTPPVTPPMDIEPYRFVASAQLIHRKGLDVLIRACERLPESGWTLEIFGDGPLKRTLEQQAARTARPVFFRGLLPYEQKDKVFQNRHCFVFSTRWDGWGMVLPEALAMGLPVITTDQAMSAHDFIRDGRNGRIVPANDSIRLAEAMSAAIDSRDNLTRQSIAAKESLAEYSPEVGAEKLIGFLRQVSAKAA